MASSPSVCGKCGTKCIRCGGSIPYYYGKKQACEACRKRGYKGDVFVHDDKFIKVTYRMESFDPNHESPKACLVTMVCPLLLKFDLSKDVSSSGKIKITHPDLKYYEECNFVHRGIDEEFDVKDCGLTDTTLIEAQITTENSV
jgi:hypothetical protein